MKKIFTLIGSLIVFNSANAHAPFSLTYGGLSQDMANDIQKTSDGGYIMVGAGRFGSIWDDVYLIRIDSLGDTLWTKHYGGPGLDIGISVMQTTDGGFIIGGRTQSFGLGGSDALLIRTNSTGDTLWTRTFGIMGSSWEEINHVIQSFDGGFVFAGSADNNIYLVKTDANGDTLWTRTIGALPQDRGFYVQETADSSLVVAGWGLGAAGFTDIYLLKTNSNGDTLWTKRYGGAFNEEAYCIEQTTDGGYIVSGFASLTTNNFDVVLLKLDNNGNVQWTKTFAGSNYEYGYSVKQTPDGGYIIAGKTGSFGFTFNNYNDAYLIRTDSTGNMLWSKTYGGLGNESAATVLLAPDGGFIFAGFASSFSTVDFYLVKTDSIGNSACSQNQSSPAPITASPVMPVVGYPPSTTVGHGGIMGHAPMSFTSEGMINTGCNYGAIYFTNISPFTGCLNLPVTLSWLIIDTITTGTYEVEISDSNHSYATHHVLTGFTIPTPQVSGTLNTLIYGVPPASNSYLMRINRTSFPTATGNSGGVYLQACTASLNVPSFSPVNVCQNFPVTLTWQLTDSISIGTYEVEISDSIGSFASPVVLGQFNITAPQASDTITVNVGSVPPGNCYRLRVKRITPPTLTGNPSTTCLHVVYCPVGIIDAQQNETSHLFAPNPATNQLIIYNRELKIKEIEIYDVFGQSIFNQRPTANSQQLIIDVSSLPNGVYFVQIKSAEKTFSHKLIISR